MAAPLQRNILKMRWEIQKIRAKSLRDNTLKSSENIVTNEFTAFLKYFQRV